MMLLIILSYLWLSLIVSSKALSDAATPAQRRNISTKNQKFLTVKKLDARTLPLYCFVRAGDSSADDDQQQDDVEEEEEEYDDDDEIEEEEDEDDDTLTTSSIRSAQKSVKTELAQVIMEQKNKPIRRKRKQNFSFLLKMPYILRALLNPFTVMSMTKSYFASLLNIDYMKDEVRDGRI